MKKYPQTRAPQDQVEAAGVNPFTMADLIDAHQSGKHLSFNRYNDGEWSVLMGLALKNADGHKEYPDMRQAMYDRLERKEISGDFRFCTGGGRHWDSVNRWMRECGVQQTWYDGDVLARPNVNGELGPIISHIRKANVVLVAPVFVCDRLVNRLSLSHCVRVPVRDRNCWLDYNEIKRQACYAVTDVRADLVMVSCGYPASVLIHDLHDEFYGEVSIWDCGAMWDVWCGRNSRGVFRDLPDWKQRMEKSLAGA